MDSEALVDQLLLINQPLELMNCLLKLTAILLITFIPETKAQIIDKNNINNIQIIREDFYNPMSSGDINPEYSNKGMLLIQHKTPPKSWTAYSFDLSKIITRDTLDKLIEKVGTREDEDICVHRYTRDTIYCHDYFVVYPWLLSGIDTNDYLECITKKIRKGETHDVIINVELITVDGFSQEKHGYVFTNNLVYDWNLNPPYHYLLIGNNGPEEVNKRFMITEPEGGINGYVKSLDDNTSIEIKRIIHKSLANHSGSYSIQKQGFIIVEDLSSRYWFIKDDRIFNIESNFSNMNQDEFISLGNVLIIKRIENGLDSTTTLFSTENKEGFGIPCSFKAQLSNYKIYSLNSDWYVPILCKDGKDLKLIDYKNQNIIQVPKDLYVAKGYGSAETTSPIYKTTLKKELLKYDVGNYFEDKVIFMNKRKTMYIYQEGQFIVVDKKYIDQILKNI